ncbi:hypothetical protein AVEN_22608-1, partial [Araneus ventricosus]
IGTGAGGTLTGTELVSSSSFGVVSFDSGIVLGPLIGSSNRPNSGGCPWTRRLLRSSSVVFPSVLLSHDQKLKQLVKILIVFCNFSSFAGSAIAMALLSYDSYGGGKL